LKHTINTTIALVLYVLLVVLSFSYAIPWWLFIVPGLAWFTIAGLGSGFVCSNYHVKALCSAKTTTKRIAITFDDGPAPETEKVLDLLKQYGAKATFFCIGRQVEKYPEILARIINEGHTVGNHTYSHSPALTLSPHAFQELVTTNELIEKVTGKRTRLFRPPYGVTAPNIAKALKRTGHTVIGWNIRSLDAIIMDEQKIFKRITDRLKPGSIILLHDTSLRSVNVLEQLLVLLHENGYEAVTIDELLNIPAYEE
jgi:peptidoglycan-N-acetylglucosamine deacetylase